MANKISRKVFIEKEQFPKGSFKLGASKGDSFSHPKDGIDLFDLINQFFVSLPVYTDDVAAEAAGHPSRHPYITDTGAVRILD